MIRSIALATALSVASPALAQPAAGTGAFMFESGTSLLGKCRNKAPEYALACTAYIVGVVDGIRKDTFIGRGRPVCWPDAMQAQDARKIVVAYLERWPDQRKSPASVLVSVALNERYPCQK
ncbi:Rap1a/Tai family immunity protein [Sphingobium sp.]|uniref:Rap1a/Tai family immunity protein n=1 Tax=Sphingobium sp. TaxID=1912891 RepID=UPI003BB4B909